MKTALFPRISIVVFLLISSTALFAGTQANGVMILNSSKGNDARNVTFTSINWSSFDGGSVTATDGTTSVFEMAEISRVVYLNTGYYNQMKENPDFSVHRNGIDAREVAVDATVTTIETDEEAHATKVSEAALEEIVERYPSVAPLLSGTIDDLKDKISRYDSGQVEVSGGWMTRADYIARIRNHQPSTAGTFTSRDGTTYIYTSVQLSDVGLNVNTADGGTTVPLEQLPVDGKGLPLDVVEKLRTLKAISAVQPITPIIAGVPTSGGTATFTTKSGKTYTNVVVEVCDVGINIPTSNGGETVYFDELTDDRKGFPPNVAEKIDAAIQAEKAANESKVASNQSQNPSPHVTGDIQQNVPVSIEEIEKQIRKDPYNVQWTWLLDRRPANSPFVELEQSFDKDLPSDVLDALSFIRQKSRRVFVFICHSNHTLLVADCSFGYLNVMTVNIPDLDPDSLTKVTTQSRSYFKAYVTLRKLLVKRTCIPPNDSEMEESLYLSVDEQAVERVGHAFRDIVVSYGGKSEPLLQDQTSNADLVTFIKNKLNKKHSCKIDLSLDQPTGILTCSYTNKAYSKKESKIIDLPPVIHTIDIRHLSPDDFRYSTSDDGTELSSDASQNDFKWSCVNDDDGKDVLAALTQICASFGWKPSKY